MAVIPNVRALLVADQVFQQAPSGKWCVIGVFERIWANRYPIIHHSLGLFVVLGDAEGDLNVKFEFRNAQDQVLGTIEGVHLQIPHRLATATFGIQTNQLVIPAPGKYFFRVYFNGVQSPNDIPIDAVELPNQA